MGTSTSWIAVEGASVAELAAHLRFVAAPDDGEIDGAPQATIVPSGWALIVSRMKNAGVVEDARTLRGLARRWRTVACDEESHIMYAAACEWRDGREVWAVAHSSAETAVPLMIRGALPPGSIEVREKWLAQDVEAAASGARVDYVYEIPLEIARLVVGYRLDSDDDETLTYVPLIPRRWWRFW